MKKLRCYAKPEGSVYVSVCIDLSLATQATSMIEAMMSLEELINYFVDDVRENEPEFTVQLMQRRSPQDQRLTYLALKISEFFGLLDLGRTWIVRKDIEDLPQIEMQT